MQTDMTKAPKILRDAYTQGVEFETTRRGRKIKEARARYAIQARAFSRVTFARVVVDIESMCKEWHFRNVDTINDAENDVSERVDFGYIYGREYARDYMREHGDDARAIFRFLCPAAPVARYAEEIESDLLRSVSQAMADDYRVQFGEFMREELETAADAIAGDGIAWTWLDSAGKPTAEWYDAPSIGFAISRREYVRKDGALWRPWWHDKNKTNRDNYSSVREMIENADEEFSEYIGEMRADNLADLSNFDDRGSVYADADQWPVLMHDYSEACEAFERDDKKMRARLREMMRNRAPLELRAALVASVYGTPGTVDESDED